MRESTKFALTTASIALLVAGILSITLAKSANDVGRVVTVGFKTPAAMAAPVLVRVNGSLKGNRLPLRAPIVKDQELADGTPIEEVEIHQEEINALPPNTTRIAKQ